MASSSSSPPPSRVFVATLISVYLLFAVLVPTSVTWSTLSGATAGKSVAYNVSFAIMIIELLKWTSAIVMDILNYFPPPPCAENQDVGEGSSSSTKRNISVTSIGNSNQSIQDGSRSDDNNNITPLNHYYKKDFIGRPIAYSTWKNYLKYGAPALLFAIENNLKVYATFYLKPAYFALFNTSKMFFAAFFARIILKQKFTTLQWLGLYLLMMSLCVAKSKTLVQAMAAADSDRRVLEGSSVINSESLSLSSLRPMTNLALESESSSESMSSLNKELESDQLLDTFPYYMLNPDSIPDLHNNIRYFNKFISQTRRNLIAVPTSQQDADVDLNSTSIFMYGLFLCAIVSVFSGLAGVTNEWLLKKTDENCSIMRKNAWMYEWGIVFNIISVGILGSKGFGYMIRNPTEILNGFDNIGVLVMIISTAGMGVSVSLIFKFFDNVIKCYCAAFAIFLISAVSYVAFGHKIDIFFGLALLIFGVASYMYMGPHNAIIKKWEEDQKRLKMKEEKVGLTTKSVGVALE